MNEIPIFFNGPKDDVNSIDPYKEFKIESVESLIYPEENKISDEGISLDKPKEKQDDIESIIQRTGQTLQTKADALADMDPEFIESIEDRMKREAKSLTDFYYDNNLTYHSKDQSVTLDKLVKTLNAVDQIYGTLCVDGIKDLSFDIAFSESMLLDMLKNGLNSFAKCFLENKAINNIKTILSNSIISMGVDIISHDGFSTIQWLNSTIENESKGLYNTNFLKTVVQRYELPPSVRNVANELLRGENALNSVKSDWYYFKNDDVKDFVNLRADVIKSMSTACQSVFSTDDKYTESLAIANSYDIENDFKNYELFI